MCLPSGNLSGDDRSGGSALGERRKEGRKERKKERKKGGNEVKRGRRKEREKVIEDGRIQRGQRL